MSVPLLAAPAGHASADRESEAWYRALFEQATDLIIVLDADGRRRFVSPSVSRLLGYEIDTYLAFSTFELIHPDDQEDVRAGHADCLARPGSQPPGRYRVRHADGSWRTFEATRNNLLANPAVRGIVITTRDVTDQEEARARLHASEAQFRSAFASAAIGMALVGLDGRWLAVNPALCHLTGYDRAELLALTFQAITHPDDLDADLEHVASLLAGASDSYQMEKRYLRKDGSIVWVLLSVSLVRDEAGQPLRFIAQIQDISARLAAEQTLRDSEARFRALLANAGDIFLLLDGGGRVRWASPSVKRLLGFDPGQLVGRANADLAHPDDRRTLRRTFIETVRAGGEPHLATIRFRHRDDSYRALEAVSSSHLDDPAIGGVVVNARDVSDRLALQERLRQDALRDPLTGLANRTALEERLRTGLTEARHSGEPTAVLFIDLNGFKPINDTLGHAAGDQLLKLVAGRLASNVRPTDLVARIGGDEFAVALPSVRGREEIEAIVQRLLNVFALPMPIAGTAVTVGASIGWAVSAGAGGVADLLAEADLAMYAEKQCIVRPARASRSPRLSELAAAR